MIMENNIEQATEEYSLACYGAVRRAINSVTIAWYPETKDYLRNNGYDIWVHLPNGELRAHACVCKGDYWSYTLYDDADIQREIQAALDTLSAQVVLNAMLALKINNVNQTTRWGIY